MRAAGPAEFTFRLIDRLGDLYRGVWYLQSRSSLTLRPAEGEVGFDGAWRTDVSFRDASLSGGCSRL
jgi:hypothetical protein